MRDLYETHFIQIDNRLPVVVVQLVEVSHADLPEIARVESVQVRPVMVLPAGHAPSAGVFAMLAYSAVPGRDVPSTVMWVGKEEEVSWVGFKRGEKEGRR